MNKEPGDRRKLAQELADLWDENEETMGEQAAYCVSCEMLGIDEDEGYELLAELEGAGK